MPSESLQTTIPSYEPFTDHEYITLRELGGQAVGEILKQDPYHQVFDFCDIARNGYDLRGNDTLIEKSLGMAFEQAGEIGTGRYLPGEPQCIEQSPRAYIHIAKTAAGTGRSPDYAFAALDEAVQQIIHRGSSGELLIKAADVAHEIEPSGKRVDEFLNLIVDKEHLVIEGEEYYKTCGLDSVLKYSALYELGDESAVALIGTVRKAVQSWESSGEKVDGLTAMARVVSQHAQRPKVAQEGFETLTVTLLEEAREEALQSDNVTATISYLAEVAKASHSTGQSQDYAKNILEQGLEIALAETEEDPSTTIARIHELIAASIKLEQCDFNDEYLTKPALDFIRDLDVSPRKKHELLNQLIGKWSVPDDFIQANGIERKPLSFVFKDS